jgi:hypothetical protein
MCTAPEHWAAPCAAGTPQQVDNHTPMVGHFTVAGLQHLPDGVHVTLAIDASGILEVCFLLRIHSAAAVGRRVPISTVGMH